LSHPERLYQVVVDGLPSASPGGQGSARGAVFEGAPRAERAIAHGQAQSLIYLFFILAFGLVGLAWVIKILFV
jgi:hypothetical protein